MAETWQDKFEQLQRDYYAQAATITTLRARIARAGEVIRPFAEEAKLWDGDAPDRRNLYGRTADGDLEPTTLKLGDLRLASSWMENGKEDREASMARHTGTKTTSTRTG